MNARPAGPPDVAPPITRLRGRWREELPASPLRYLLAPAWAVFSAGVALRGWTFARGLRRPRRLPRPVISIGNLTVGGTGKTPAVRQVCALVRALGGRPVVLSRGYRGSAAGNEEAQLVGDVPVVSDSDRHAGGLRAIREHQATCLVLDDGFQHRQLHRDLDLVLIDATDPWGGGALLPLGRLREGRSALARADLLWLTRSDLCTPGERERLQEELSATGRPLITSTQGVPSLQGLDGQPRSGPLEAIGAVLLSCGLGNPAGFEATARQAGLSVVGALRWPDHHAYTPADLQELLARAQGLGARAVVSAKDAVKLKALATPEQAAALIVLQAHPQLQPDGQARLEAAVRAVLAGGADDAVRLAGGA